MGAGQLPFFVQWVANLDPSTDGKVDAKIELSGDENTITKWLGSDLHPAIGGAVETAGVPASENDGKNEMNARHLAVPTGFISLEQSNLGSKLIPC